MMLGMNQHSHEYERCHSFVHSNFVKTCPVEELQSPAVTISRQRFSHAHDIAEELLTKLSEDPLFNENKWALFDRDLVHKILEDHHLPQAISRYMPEDRDHDFSGIINEILGLHPSLWELFHHTCDTILKLASVGNVILIGRGGHVIARNLSHVIHVRIIAPMGMRIQRAASIENISPTAATRMIKHDDHARAAFIKSHFDEDPDNPEAYHLTINTGKTDPKTAADIILSAIKGQQFDNS
ncbi:MAG: AAA family ATPase [Puniceicoccaceae bacterium]